MQREGSEREAVRVVLHQEALSQFNPVYLLLGQWNSWRTGLTLERLVDTLCCTTQKGETVCNMRKRDMWDIFDCGHRSKHHKAGASVHVTKGQHTTETFTSTSSAIGNLASSAGHVIRMPSFLHKSVHSSSSVMLLP